MIRGELVVVADCPPLVADLHVVGLAVLSGGEQIAPAEGAVDDRVVVADSELGHDHPSHPELALDEGPLAGGHRVVASDARERLPADVSRDEPARRLTLLGEPADAELSHLVGFVPDPHVDARVDDSVGA